MRLNEDYLCAIILEEVSTALADYPKILQTRQTNYLLATGVRIFNTGKG